ncbi:hypothetical protein [Mesorhizobium kowhaii]|uniref:Uncharacterized protein n=1 Tax=Mesorhizobium kowhaii TaxID=1300272 RepID=A0A2W7C3B1_9HYPH|nr:hypothetical protein [Mesorhizobium kowhaii]PZV37605.1 hypothetical protein B5V02_15075 [Mesorhizobium kowhaii]
MSVSQLVEPAIVPDIFVTGSAPLQFMGGNVRLTLFVSQVSTLDGSAENAIVSKLVGSRSDMLKIAAAIVRGCNAGSTPRDKLTETFVQFLEAPEERH